MNRRSWVFDILHVAGNVKNALPHINPFFFITKFYQYKKRPIKETNIPHWKGLKPRVETFVNDFFYYIRSNCLRIASFHPIIIIYALTIAGAYIGTYIGFILGATN